MKFVLADKAFKIHRINNKDLGFIVITVVVLCLDRLYAGNVKELGYHDKIVFLQMSVIVLMSIASQTTVLNTNCCKIVA